MSPCALSRAQRSKVGIMNTSQVYWLLVSFATLVVAKVSASCLHTSGEV